MGDTASNGSGTYAPATWIACTADATTPAATSTTLTGELTGGTFARGQGVYSHTTGTSSYTLTKSFTSDRIVTVAKFGVFTASTAGVMVFETLLDSTAALRSGDTFQIVHTVPI